MNISGGSSAKRLPTRSKSRNSDRPSKMSGGNSVNSLAYKTNTRNSDRPSKTSGGSSVSSLKPRNRRLKLVNP